MEVTEQEMREAEVPSPKSQKELLAYIESLVNREHDYGTCVYAMSMSAVATFNYVAGMLGVTGFQASCADLDILRRTRSLKGPFSIQRGEDWLYPQYDPEERLRKFRVEISEWLSAEAKQLLKERDSAHPNVVAHWQKLAGA